MFLDYLLRVLLLSALIVIITSLSEAKEFQFSFYLSAGETYDDNIFFVNDNLKKQDDFITAVTPGLSAVYDGKRTDFSLNYRARLEFYSQFDEKNSADNHSGNLNFDYRISKNIFFTVTDSLRFTAAENQLLGNEAFTAMSESEKGTIRIPTEETVSNILTYRSSDILTNVAESSLSYNVSPSLSMITGCRQRITEYDSPSFTDTTEQEVNFRSDYRLKRFNRLNLTGRYRDTIFDTGKHNKNYSGQAGLSHTFSSTASMSVSGGITYSDENNGTAWVGRANVSRRLKHGNILAGYERTVTPTRGFSGTSMTQSYYIIFSQMYSNRLNSEVSARYINSDDSRGENIGTDTISSSVSLNYIITKKIRGNLYYSHTYQDYDNRERGLINLHQFRISAGYNWNRWLGIRLLYSYFYRKTSIEKWPVRDNRILLGVNTAW